MREQISEITEIQVEALIGASLEDFSVAQRMCWASRRQTTRIEDEAYSLMGIFGVHMPMLYGEGSHGFIRLQEEIIKRSTDCTIFAWATGFPATRSYTGGLLADCPATFANTKHIIQDTTANSSPFEITNKGVHLHLPIYEEAFGILDCQDMNRPGYNVAISLTRKDSSNTFQFEYFRGTVSVAKEERKDAPIQSIYVTQGSSAKPLPPGFHFQSAKFYYECSFPLSGITLKRRGPGSWLELTRPWAGSVTPWSGLTLISENIMYYGTLEFTDKANNSFIVSLKSQSPVNSPSIHGRINCRVYIYADGKTFFGEGHDRILWQHPITKWWISIGMSRAIISWKRAMVVTIKDEPM
jgi:hypothetical protein